MVGFLKKVDAVKIEVRQGCATVFWLFTVFGDFINGGSNVGDEEKVLKHGEFPLRGQSERESGLSAKWSSTASKAATLTMSAAAGDGCEWSVGR